MNAAFGLRFFAAVFFTARLAGLFAAFLAVFFAFFFAAILTPGRWNGEDHPREDGRFSYENRPPSSAKSIILGAGRNREMSRFPSEKSRFPSENRHFS
jgi:hypothetical protein